MAGPAPGKDVVGARSQARAFRNARAWPWIAASAVALAMLGASAASQPTPDNINALRARSLELVNEAREREGLRSLQQDPELTEAAQAHALDMLQRDFYAHVTPEGRTVMDRYEAAGGSPNLLLAENIARCRNCPVPADAATVAELHEGWMSSPEHRENILAEGLTRYGFGVAEDLEGTRYSVQTFAGPGATAGAEAGAEPQPIAPPAQTELAVALINDERAAAATTAVSADPRLIEAARNVIPNGDLTEVALDELNPLQQALPAEVSWQRLQIIAGSCGGCGVEATDADVRFFLKRWLDNSRYRDILNDPRLTSMGMAIEPDGRGRKIAVAVLAGD